MGHSRFDFDYHNRPLAVVIEAGHDLVLYLDGVARKRRSSDNVTCVYVWTNVELEWEEHHFIEARWWPAEGRVRVTANGATLLEHLLPSGV